MSELSETRYELRPQVEGEPDPVILTVKTMLATRDDLEMHLSISGARRLRTMPGFDFGTARIVMRAGASYSRYTGVRLSNGFNVVDPDTWRRQGIGTIALNRMIAWAKERHLDADLRPIELKRYGRNILPNDPRLTFYHRFNIRWDVADQHEDSPDRCSIAMKVAELQIAPQPINIRAFGDD